MSIASRIESMTTHLQNDYNALESVVGTITEDKNIENIAPILDNLWETLPKSTGTGTSLSLSTKAGKMKIDLYGNTSQESLSGKNLFNVNEINKPTGITTDDEGWITINLNNSSGTTVKLLNFQTPANSLIKPSIYYSVFLEVKSVSGTGTLTINESSANTQFNGVVAQQFSSLSANTTYKFTPLAKGDVSTPPRQFTSYAYNNAGETGTITFRLSLIEGTSLSVDDFTYEPYCGGTASPNPSYPQQIHTVTGDNTINVSNSDNSQHTDYSLTLGSIELNKIGTYQDYFYKDNGNWYLHKEIGKVVLDGSETDWRYNSNNALFVHNITSIGKFAGANVVPDIKCNYFMPNTFNILYSEEADYGISNGSSSADVITIRNKDITSVANFQTWLSTHNTDVYYVLATPTYTKITGTLAEQLEAVWRAYSYKGTTNISQVNDDLPFNLDITALEG